MVTTPLGLVQLLLLVGAFIVTVLSSTGAGAAVARCAPADHLAAAGGRAQVTDAPVRATLPPPAACGAPASFLEWRQGQPEAICHVVDSPQRISALVLPTGSGKSLVAATLATLTGWRTAILTSTKGLQDQIGAAFAETGLNDLRGQTAYRCRALDPGAVFFEYRAPHIAYAGCDQGPCRAGLRCPWRDIGCFYFDAVAKAQRTRLLVTNYQAWMSQYQYGEGLGAFDCLVLDEAHAAPEEVATFLAATLTPRALALCGLVPPANPDIWLWIAWAGLHLKPLKRQVDKLGEIVKDGHASAGLIDEYQKKRATYQLLERLSIAAPDEWIVTSHGDHEFHPVNVAIYTEAALLRGIKKVVLTSATLTPKTVDALGLPPDDIAWLVAPSTFPVERRPVVHIATCRIDHKLDDDGIRLWLMRLDQILGAREDRKGIVHTGSYARAKLIHDHSQHRHRLMLHDRGTTRTQVEAFRRAGPGAVMVSPSLTTGFDFAGQACEYQVILKVPWPDSREPIVAARTLRDKTYPAYVAMQDLVQAVGRGMRSEEDRCETFILDDHVQWFVRSHASFAPQWFLDAYRHSQTIPPPPPPL